MDVLRSAAVPPARAAGGHGGKVAQLQSPA
jgi:hypothetical protein